MANDFIFWWNFSQTSIEGFKSGAAEHLILSQFVRINIVDTVKYVKVWMEKL